MHLQKYSGSEGRHKPVPSPLLVPGAGVGKGLWGRAALPSPDGASLIFPTCGSVLLWHRGKWISKREACFSCLFLHLGARSEKQFFTLERNFMEMSRQQDSVWFPLYITAINLPESGRAARSVPRVPQPSLTLIARSDLIFFLPWVFLPKLPQKKGVQGVLGTGISYPAWS